MLRLEFHCSFLHGVLMFKDIAPEGYFDIIKQNYHAYLRANMITHLGSYRAQNKKNLVDNYIIAIEDYRKQQESYLDDAIRGPSVIEEIKRGTISSLLGLSLGAATFGAEQKIPSADLMGVKTSAQAGFAAAISASATALIFTIWNESTVKSERLDYNQLREVMEQNGFSKERFNELSSQLVQLFHYRECLLLGLKTTDGVNMREAFLRHYYPLVHENDIKDDVNLAIEVYFQQQLNHLFTHAFEEIYNQHTRELDEEHAQPVINWFKKNFRSTNQRERFTQKIQIKYISECIRFLEKEMAEPSFFGKYTWLCDIISGFISAAFVLAVFAIMNTAIQTLGLIGIVVATAALAALATHGLIHSTDKLFYKRDAANRQAIHTTIKSITKEHQRLTQLVQHVVFTSKKEIRQLHQFYRDDHPFLGFGKRNHIFAGSLRSWVRELSARYRDSEAIDIDLSKEIKHVMMESTKQHAHLIQLIKKNIHQGHSNHDQEKLAKYINETKAYLMHPEHLEFIRSFKLREKIKEQILEIIGQLEPEEAANLPQVISDFYLLPVRKGGLSGLASDLSQCHHLARILGNETAPSPHPYEHLLNTAFYLSHRLNASVESEYILRGDDSYRKILGLFTDDAEEIEQKLSASTIERYLHASFSFLCLLNDYRNHRSWDAPFENNDAYLIYRMLLVKQLAHLADANNRQVDSFIKLKVREFTKNSLNYNPDQAFYDASTQAMLKGCNGDRGSLIDPLGSSHPTRELADIADAIRVDIAHEAEPLSSKKLIDREAQKFLISNSTQRILAYNSMTLVAENSDAFARVIQEMLKTTQAFISWINRVDLLKETNTLALYGLQIASEKQRLLQQIERISQVQPITSLNSHLVQARADLTAFIPGINTTLPLASATVLVPHESAAVVISAEQRQVPPQSTLHRPQDNSQISQDDENDSTGIEAPPLKKRHFHFPNVLHFGFFRSMHSENTNVNKSDAHLGNVNHV